MYSKKKIDLLRISIKDAFGKRYTNAFYSRILELAEIYQFTAAIVLIRKIEDGKIDMKILDKINADEMLEKLIEMIKEGDK